MGKKKRKRKKIKLSFKNLCMTTSSAATVIRVDFKYPLEEEEEEEEEPPLGYRQ